MTLRIERVGFDRAAALAALRAQLWTDVAASAHAAEIAARLAEKDHRRVYFVSVSGDEVSGFIEASLRTDYVNGCDTTPVAFVEGLYVAPLHRRRGIAGKLCEAVEAWGRVSGCEELGSDAELLNAEGQKLHLVLGFEETERVVFFRKRL